MKNKKKRIGLLGGSFDPPHIGHLIIAQDAYEALGLDGVWFIPNFLSPHKSTFHLSPQQRLSLVDLMIRDDPRFESLDIEIKRGQSQFTIDTVRYLTEEHQDTDFFWLIGTDQLKTLHTWKSIDVVLDLVQFVVFKRPGYHMKIPDELKTYNLLQVDIHEVLISSSEIRDRIENNLPVYMFLHPAVNDHIDKFHFYKNRN